MSNTVLCLGPATTSGIYLLRLRVGQTLAVAFGRFHAGQPLTLYAGDYLYVGSALATKGAMSLAQRLIRHATRTASGSPHAIRSELLSIFNAARADHPPKKLFWHIDYLLDQAEVELIQVFALRTTQKLERPLAQRLATDAHTFVVAKGLGARDDPGGTHLLGVHAPESWWLALPDLLCRCLGEDKALKF